MNSVLLYLTFLCFWCWRSIPTEWQGTSTLVINFNCGTTNWSRRIRYWIYWTLLVLNQWTFNQWESAAFSVIKWESPDFLVLGCTQLKGMFLLQAYLHFFFLKLELKTYLSISFSVCVMAWRPMGIQFHLNGH